MGRNRSRTNIQKVILDYEVDNASVNEADAAAQKVLDRFTTLQAQANKTGNRASVLANDINTLAQSENALERTSRKATEQLGKQAKTFSEVANRAAQLAQEARRAREATEEPIGGRADFLLGAVSGIPGVGGQISGIGQAAQDIIDSIGGVQNLGAALRMLGQTTANAIPGIASAGAGLATLGVAGLAVGAAAVAGALALDQWKRSNDEVVKGIEAYISASREIEDFENINLARDRYEELNDEIATNQETIDKLQNSYNQLTNGFGVITRVADGFNVRGLKTMREEIERLQGEVLEANFNLGELINQYGLDIIATKHVVTAEELLIAKREEQTRATEAAAEATAKWTAAQTQASESARDAALATLDAQRNTAKFIEELRDIGDTSAQESALEAASEGRIDKLNAAFDKFATATEKRIGAINRTLQANVTKAQKDFMRESVQANAKFLEQERQQQEANNRDRLRMLEDLNDDLLSAEEANDVIRFIQVQRAGEKNLRRFDEDASAEQKQRSREFIIEQKERHAEFKRRITDMRAAAEQRIQLEREKLQERRALLRQQIADERAALVQQILDARSAAVAQIQLRRQQFIQELRDQQMFNAQRAAIEAQHQANLTLIALQAQQKQAALLRQALQTPFAKKATGTTSSPFAKSGTGSPVINIGSIGSDLTMGQVKGAVTSAFFEYEGATRSGVLTDTGARI